MPCPVARDVDIASAKKTVSAAERYQRKTESGRRDDVRDSTAHCEAKIAKRNLDSAVD